MCVCVTRHPCMHLSLFLCVYVCVCTAIHIWGKLVLSVGRDAMCTALSEHRINATLPWHSSLNPNATKSKNHSSMLLQADPLNCLCSINSYPNSLSIAYRAKPLPPRSLASKVLPIRRPCFRRCPAVLLPMVDHASFRLQGTRTSPALSLASSMTSTGKWHSPPTAEVCKRIVITVIALPRASHRRLSG